MSISTMNDDLNILQNLAIPAFEEDVDVIQKLDDEPNDVGGLTAAELKAKFDEAGNRIKTYLNETLLPSISETVAEAEERAEAEAARVLAEEQRAAAEQERVSAEAEREQAEEQRATAEQERVSAEAEREQAEAERRAGEAARVSAEEERAAAETARKEAEAARALAEQNRVDTDNGIVAQATKAAEDAETAKDNAEKAAETASSAAIHQPIVGDNQNWWTWNIADGAYVDTGIYAAGHSPYIGDNGNWWIGAEDTGVAATGPQGPQGETGSGFKVLDYYATLDALEAAVPSPEPGDAYGVGTGEPYDIYIYGKSSGWVNNGPLQGAKGDTGQDGVSPSVSVSEITGGHRVSIQDADGTSSFDVMDGVDGQDGAAGAAGYTPVRGTDYWTAADQQAIVDAVLAALPAAEGVNV